ncbi:lysylphosphatidylglycerol synthase transmembrane domain-containing protein [Nodosilinea sp. PGN35]|uniref:lysylphosphatidylglycerol synthase transmembrane domain-containing protein n=1 Tax=Nodosilinea sp. PGN35 TaxID=3020489 RepID=UPI0023B32FFC|nr:lysylphosphatidylglycerol synthase transmembrane domain-containing protein [Nodosilinea sp. TSF1-S3]MDF0367017.1 lysylphosphatidylglycerol synthase transmembrane domain-containing protein [Nodosilinea sp. TSF1-S3]
MNSPPPAQRAAPWRRGLSLAIAAALTVGLLGWALRDARPAQVWDSLRQAQGGWVLAAWLAYMAVFWVRAWRWGTLLGASVAPGRFRSRLLATFVGFGASSVLPAHAGELVRSALLHRRDRVPLGPSLGTIVVERLLDVGVVFGLLVLAAAGLPAGSLARSALGAVAAAIVGGWLGLLLAGRFPRAIAAAIAALGRRLGMPRLGQRLGRAAMAFLSGLAVLRQPRRTALALGQTLLGWGLNGLTYWAVLRALGIDGVGLAGAFFTQSATALAIALPSSPGYIGPFEAGLRYALGLYGVAAEQAIACAILLRFLMYVTVPLIAGAILLGLGLRATDLGLWQAPPPVANPKTPSLRR